MRPVAILPPAASTGSLVSARLSLRLQRRVLRGATSGGASSLGRARGSSGSITTRAALACSTPGCIPMDTPSLGQRRDTWNALPAAAVTRRATPLCWHVPAGRGPRR
jgi:hypothetical protein